MNSESLQKISRCSLAPVQACITRAGAARLGLVGLAVAERPLCRIIFCCIESRGMAALLDDMLCISKRS